MKHLLTLEALSDPIKKKIQKNMKDSYHPYLTGYDSNYHGPLYTMWMFVDKMYDIGKVPITKEIHAEHWDEEFEKESGRSFNDKDWMFLKMISKNL